MADILSQLEELDQFLTVRTRNDVKLKALEYIQGITSHGEYALELLQKGKIIKPLTQLFLEDPDYDVRRECARALVNFTINDVVSSSTCLLNERLIDLLLKDVLDRSSNMSDASAMLLTNLTRIESNVKVVQPFIKDSVFNAIVGAFVDSKFNPRCQLNYLGSFISNMLMLKHYRQILLVDLRAQLQDILRYTTYEASDVRRASAARILKNCSFETEHHEWLLGEEMDVLSQLLLPLAGPEELDDDEMEQLPLDLQYLPSDKQRESDPEIRIILLNTLHQLCTTQHGRETLRKNGVYYVLRELHKWEKNELVVEALEPIVQLMIITEPELSIENLKTCDIPKDIMEKLESSTPLQTYKSV